VGLYMVKTFYEVAGQELWKPKRRIRSAPSTPRATREVEGSLGSASEASTADPSEAPATPVTREGKADCLDEGREHRPRWADCSDDAADGSPGWCGQEELEEVSVYAPGKITAVSFRSNGYAVRRDSTLASLLTEAVGAAAAEPGRHGEEALQLQTAYQWFEGRSFAHVVIRPRAGGQSDFMSNAEMKRVQKLLEILLKQERRGRRSRLQCEAAWTVAKSAGDQ